MTTLDSAKTRTQNDRIRSWLLAGQSITPMDALHYFGCFRLGARIWDLRQEGMDIKKQMVRTPGGAYVASYRLATHQFPLV